MCVHAYVFGCGHGQVIVAIVSTSVLPLLYLSVALEVMEGMPHFMTHNGPPPTDPFGCGSNSLDFDENSSSPLSKVDFAI